MYNLILTTLLAFVLSVIIYHGYHVVCWYRHILVVGREVDKLPGIKKHWLYGTLADFPGANEAGLKYLLSLGQQFGGRVFHYWLGPFRPGATVFHPDTMKHILNTADPKAIAGNGPYKLTQPWIGDGLIIAGGEKWKRNRKLLTPGFHFDILKLYMQVYNNSVDVLLGKWDKLIRDKPVESIEISTSISLCTLDIIMTCAFSSSTDVQLSHKFIMHLDWIYYKSSRGKRFVKTCEFVHMVTENIIAKRKKILSDKQIDDTRRHDFLDIILLAKDETGQGLTDLEIRNEVDTFLFAGHDTTSSAMTWILYNLARHPEIQERVYEEVNALIGDRDSPNITWEDVGSEFHYLTMCIKESLRLHTPVPFIMRDLQNSMEVDGVTLLPGTMVGIAIYLCHHNNLVWGEDHMEYKPERFDQEKLKHMPPNSFIAFSAGPRYQLEVDASHKVELLPEIVLRPKYGIKLKMKPRA